MPKNPTTIITVQLKPDAQQAESLDQTILQFANACNELSKSAYQKKVYGRWQMYREYYKEIRKQFKLNAGLTSTCCLAVFNAYHSNSKDKLIQRSRYDVPYNTNSIRWMIKTKQVSMWSANGRIIVPFECDRRISTIEAGWIISSLQKQADGTYLLLVECVMEGNILIKIQKGANEILLPINSDKTLVMANGLVDFLKPGSAVSLIDESGKEQFIASVSEPAK